MPYIVKALNCENQKKIFEGPLDLLLDLIERRKLKITEVSLAEVADQFLEYLEKAENIKLAWLADFLSVASKLILIKSKTLLPMLELTEEEEEDIEELKRRMEEYKKFKEAAKNLGLLDKNGKSFYSRQSYSGMITTFLPPEDISLNDLKNAFQNVLNKIPKVEKLTEETIREVISLKDKIKFLQRSLAERVELSFGSMALKSGSRVEVIVTFLAVLEMMKRRIIIVEQGRMFGEIKLRRIENSEL